MAVNERNIWSDLHAFPRGETTLGGNPHWDNHPACALLKKDVENGKADSMQPEMLRRTRDEYKAFPLHVFRGHIYQEKRRKREEPGWVIKRNKKAQKMHDDEVNAMQADWDASLLKHDVDELCKQWERISTLD